MRVFSYSLPCDSFLFIIATTFSFSRRLHFGSLIQHQTQAMMSYLLISSSNFLAHKKIYFKSRSSSALLSILTPNLFLLPFFRLDGVKTNAFLFTFHRMSNIMNIYYVTRHIRYSDLPFRLIRNSIDVQKYPNAAPRTSI